MRRRSRRAPEASTTTALGCNVQYGAVHAGRSRGRQYGLFPDGLHVYGFCIYRLHRRIAGYAGTHAAFAVHKLKFDRCARRGFEPVVDEDATGRVELLRLLMRQRCTVLAALLE